MYTNIYISIKTFFNYFYFYFLHELYPSGFTWTQEMCSNFRQLFTVLNSNAVISGLQFYTRLGLW